MLTIHNKRKKKIMIYGKIDLIIGIVDGVKC